MNGRKILLSGIGLLLLIAAAVWIATFGERPTTLTEQPLFPDFATERAQATAVRMYRAGNRQAVELRRDGEAWTVTERDHYPADVAKVGELLEQLANLKAREEKTSVADLYPQLGVEDVAGSEATGTRIEVSGAAGTMVDVIVGKTVAGTTAAGRATYVRRSGEDASWLATHVEAESDPARWIEPAVLHLDTERVQQVTFDLPGEAARSATRTERGAAHFTVRGLPRGQALASPGAADGVAAALIGVQAEDVRPRAELPAEPQARATYLTFDGLRLDIRGWVDGDRYWIAIDPGFDAAQAARFPPPPASDQPGAPRPGPDPERVAQELERLRAKLEGHAFEIEAYKYEGIFPAAATWTSR